MNETAFLQIKSLELQRLLDSVGDDSILAPQLRERLAEVESARKEGRLFPESNVVGRQFLKTLSQHGAELRLALPDAPSVAISAEEIRGASERLDELTNQQCIAELQKTTVNRITGVSTPSYVLLDAKPSQE